MCSLSAQNIQNFDFFSFSSLPEDCDHILNLESIVFSPTSSSSSLSSFISFNFANYVSFMDKKHFLQSFIAFINVTNEWISRAIFFLGFSVLKKDWIEWNKMEIGLLRTCEWIRISSNDVKLKHEIILRFFFFLFIFLFTGISFRIVHKV